jgi:hypothetical protein
MLGALLVAAIALVPLDVRGVDAATNVELNARASISVGLVDAQPSFDPALLDARAAASSVGTSSLASVVWPSFLVDAFFFLYGFQPVERIALGIAQAGWPQGPMTARASQSEAFASNLNGVIERPVIGGASNATASRDAALADVAAVTATLPGGVTLEGARSVARIDRTAGAELAVAQLWIERVQVGPLAIEGFAAEARARPGTTGEPTLTFAEMTIAGTPVRLEGDAVIAPTRALQEQVDAALAASGIEIGLLTRDADPSAARQRGLRIAVPFQGADPTGATYDARFELVLGDVSADGLARAAAARPPAPVTSRPPAQPGEVRAPVVPIAVAPPPIAAAPDVPATRIIRRVVTQAGVPAPRANARGAYAATLLLALVLLAFRPLIRQAARP